MIFNKPEAMTWMDFFRQTWPDGVISDNVSVVFFNIGLNEYFLADGRNQSCIDIQAHFVTVVPHNHDYITFAAYTAADITYLKKLRLSCLAKQLRSYTTAEIMDARDAEHQRAIPSTQ